MGGSIGCKLNFQNHITKNKIVIMALQSEEWHSITIIYFLDQEIEFQLSVET